MPPKKKKRKGKYHRGLHISPIAGECKYRSGWEQKFCIYLDSHPGVLTWSYEKTVIEYISNKRTGKTRKYYPDFLVEYRDGSKNVIEIKPKRKLTHITVIKKAEAARTWCMTHDATYILLTEIELKNMGIL